MHESVPSFMWMDAMRLLADLPFRLFFMVYLQVGAHAFVRKGSAMDCHSVWGVSSLVFCVSHGLDEQ